LNTLVYLPNALHWTGPVLDFPSVCVPPVHSDPGMGSIGESMLAQSRLFPKSGRHPPVSGRPEAIRLSAANRSDPANHVIKPASQETIFLDTQAQRHRAGLQAIRCEARPVRRISVSSLTLPFGEAMIGHEARSAQSPCRCREIRWGSVDRSLRAFPVQTESSGQI